MAKKPRIESHLDENGHEVLDDTPVSLPVRFMRGQSIVDDVQRLVRREMSRLAEANDFETFEEANDFDVGDNDPFSPYELDEDQDGNYQIDRSEFHRTLARGKREDGPPTEKGSSGNPNSGGSPGVQPKSGVDPDGGAGAKPDKGSSSGPST